MPDGINPCETYWWIAKLNYSFLLEAFVFISGYIYAYQNITHPDRYCLLSQLAKNKLHRLILPSIVFSAIYFILYEQHETFISSVYSITNGVGHMWYLPMLFWNFIIFWAIKKANFNDTTTVIMLVLLALISFIPLPLRLNSAMYYLLFFFFGGWTYKNHTSKIFDTSKNRILICWLVFITTFMALTIVDSEIDLQSLLGSSLVIKVIDIAISKVIKIIISTIGILALYLTCSWISSHHHISDWIIKLGNLSMGVYLLQQFILVWLYYYTDLPYDVGYRWLPWVGVAATIPLSVLGATILKRIPVIKRYI